MGREAEIKRKETKNFYSLIHSPEVFNSHGCIRLQPGAYDNTSYRMVSKGMHSNRKLESEAKLGLNPGAQVWDAALRRDSLQCLTIN